MTTPPAHRVRHLRDMLMNSAQSADETADNTSLLHLFVLGLVDYGFDNDGKLVFWATNMGKKTYEELCARPNA